MEANIYKLDCSLKEAKKLISDAGLEKYGVRKTVSYDRDCANITSKASCEFYYFGDKVNSKDNVTWLNQWENFFRYSINTDTIYSLHFGCILIKINKTIFFISYGRAHHLAQSNSDLNFGLDIAERILVKESITSKQSSYINNAKSREYIQYKNKVLPTPNIGESNNQVISDIFVTSKKENIKDDFYLNEFKKNIKFGTSVKLVNSKIIPLTLIKILLELEYIHKEFDPIVSLPRMVFEKSLEVKVELEKKLVNSLVKKEYNSFTLLEMINKGGELFEPFKDEKLFIQRSKTLNSVFYNLEEIVNKLSELEDLGDLKNIYLSNEDKTIKYPVLELLDYSTIHNKQRYCLFEGKWAKLNKSFLEHVKAQILIVNEISKYDSKFNYNKSGIEKVIKQRERKMGPDNIKYAEYVYNRYLEANFDYIFLDRLNEHEKYKNVEFADLYDKTERKLIHVKLGDLSKFRTCVYQSTNSAMIYSTEEELLNVYGINSVKKIGMLLVTTTKNLIQEDGSVNFNNSKSITFKLELVNWYQKVRDLNYSPEILIAIKQK
ncbi:DUF6119 family protein [Chryseomicrobium sp. FSL W7-1435]|uniref:DUF6119 family protein n=1 Tax=Chryseomicrobium sp. FSL W7-1435 TaxID=2921704 RepID=UPI00315A5DE8